MGNESLKSYEKISLNLIKEDFRFILTVLNETVKNKQNNYLVALMPYIGLIVEGSNKWGNKVKILKASIPKMSEEEKYYYEKLRLHIKFFEMDVLELNKLLFIKYNEAKNYFWETSNIICKIMGLCNVYGVFTATINDKIYPLSNTIVNSIFIPEFDYKNDNGEYIKEMSIYAGKLAYCYLKEEFEGHERNPLYTINPDIEFNDFDFGAIVKSPFGKKYNINFLLYSILNACYFCIYGINQYIIELIPMKLRATYILYYYLNKIIDDLNLCFDQNWQIDNFWVDVSVRNSLAHYGLWHILKNDIDSNDIFGGMTNLKFGINWEDLLIKSQKALISLCNQIEKYLLGQGPRHKYIFPIEND